MGFVNRFKLLLSSWRQAPPVRTSKRERYLDLEVARPSERCVGHSKVWTSADGVWYCRDCHEWFRTWEDVPERPVRQREGY